MTANQIAYWSLQETKRSNLAKEAETGRHNLATEGETHRSNVAGEQFNLSQLAETKRHNTAVEGLDLSKLQETTRHNIVSEQEQNRHNVASEGLEQAGLVIKSQQADTQQYSADTQRGSAIANVAVPIATGVAGYAAAKTKTASSGTTPKPTNSKGTAGNFTLSQTAKQAAKSYTMPTLVPKFVLDLYERTLVNPNQYITQ